MKAYVPILSSLVVGIFAGFFTVISFLGVGTWDGRSGGMSRAAAFKSDGKPARAQVAYVEVHLMWQWRDRWWTRKDKNYDKITRAISYLQGTGSVSEVEFWQDMHDMPEGGTQFLPDILAAIKADGPLWELRAYQDKDFKGREYRAVELSARVEVRSDSFPPGARKPAWSPSMLEDIMREPANKKSEIEIYLKELQALFTANPMLHEWLKPHLPKPDEKG